MTKRANVTSSNSKSDNGLNTKKAIRRCRRNKVLPAPPDVPRDEGIKLHALGTKRAKDSLMKKLKVTGCRVSKASGTLKKGSRVSRRRMTDIERNLEQLQNIHEKIMTTADEAAAQITNDADVSSNTASEDTGSDVNTQVSKIRSLSGSCTGFLRVAQELTRAVVKLRQQYVTLESKVNDMEADSKRWRRSLLETRLKMFQTTPPHIDTQVPPRQLFTTPYCGSMCRPTGSKRTTSSMRARRPKAKAKPYSTMKTSADTADDS